MKQWEEEEEPEALDGCLRKVRQITRVCFPLSIKLLNLISAGRGNRFCPKIQVIFDWNILSFGDFTEKVGAFPGKLLFPMTILSSW